MLRFGALTIAVTLLAGCGQSAPVGSSELPRRTRQGIQIEQEITTETLALPGCPTFWETVKHREPPPGACEQDTQVTTVTATRRSRQVRTEVIGEPTVDPLFLVQPVSTETEDGLTVVVVASRPSVHEVRLVDASGRVLDAVLADQPLVALAAAAEAVTVEALDASGTVVGSCPPGGVNINNVVYPCTIAPGVQPPITTTTIGTPTP